MTLAPSLVIMNIRNIAGLVVLGSLVLACSGSKDGAETQTPEANNEAAATVPAATTDAKTDEAKTTDTTDAKSDDAGAAPGKGDDDGKADDDDDDDKGGDLGAANNACCFKGEFFECPDAKACFGGFDISACIDKCKADIDCFKDCANQLEGASAPKGCTKKAPPANIKCQ